MANTENEHKNNVFCLICRDRENLLSIYNALNETDYTNADDLKIVTLEDAILLQMHNDSTFLFNRYINLYEHQSTDCPNNPLRELYYATEEYKRLVSMKELYGKMPVKIPAPRFVTFYNGTGKQPAIKTRKLSDMYFTKEENPQLELVEYQININNGYNDELLEKCECLRGYMIFVNKVRNKLTEGKMDVKRAVTEAVNECIEEGVLADFFRENKKKVIDMSIYEYNAEEHDQVLRDESYLEGHEVGLVEGKADSILDIIRFRWGNPEDIREQIKAVTDLDRLNEWYGYVFQAATFEEFRKMIE